MPSKNVTKLAVRQRAQFQCEYCHRFRRLYYAHITPDSAKGSYTLDNLLWLCDEHHKLFEVSHLPLNSPKRKSLVKKMLKIRDAKKIPSNISHKLYYMADKWHINLGNNIFNQSPCIIRIYDKPGDIQLGIDLLNINIIDQEIIINGIFYSQNHSCILQIIDNVFYTHSEDLWDLTISNNCDFSVISKDKTMWIKITQDQNETLIVSGQFYFFGKLYSFSKERGFTNPGLILNNCIVQNSHMPILIDENGVIGF